jgi:GT2 family glycosyltransferase
MPKISIVILTWNSEKHLSDLFLSLNDMDYPRSRWNLIVVDNGSKDKTIHILKHWQAQMTNFQTIIYNKQNKGFAPANNQGIRVALKDGADYVILLNDDTLVESDWLSKIINTLEQNKDIGLAQPLITHYPQVDKINSFGNQYHFLGFGYCSGEGENVNKFYLADYHPAYLSFAAVAIRTDVFRQIGFLDENYFSYHEDTDFCFRARLADWNLLVIYDAIVHHSYKFPALKDKQRYFWLEKNRFYLILKFFKPKTLLLIAPACLFMELGLIFYSAAKGFFIQRLKAYGWILINFPKILKARRQIQKTRRFGDYKLFDFMTGKIAFQPIKNPLVKYITNPVLNLYFKLIKKLI